MEFNQKDVGFQIEFRAAAHAVDRGEEIEEWSWWSFNSFADNFSTKYGSHLLLEDYVERSSMSAESRIAAANELHRREQEKKEDKPTEFDEEKFEEWKAHMVGCDQLRAIKDTKHSNEYRAAACVVDSGFILSDWTGWDNDRFERINQEQCWAVYHTTTLVEDFILVKEYLPETRISAANELHRREQEEEQAVVPSEVYNKGLVDTLAAIRDPKPLGQYGIVTANELPYNEERAQPWYLAIKGRGAGKQFSPSQIQSLLQSLPDDTLLVLAETKHDAGKFEQARAIMIERLATKTPPPKHPDVQRAIDNYPSCNHYSPGWEG